MFARQAVALAALVGLTACGGGGALEATRIGSAASAGDGSGINYDPNTQELVVGGAGGQVYELVNVAGLPSHFDSFRYLVPNAGNYIIAGQTPSGGGQAASWVGYSIVFDSRAFYQLERFSPTVLPGPDAGTVGYSGSYAGQYSRVQSNGTQSFGHVFGNANMTVDFADSSVSGFITDRERSDGLQATQVRLVATEIVDGAFVGETLGGAFVGGTALPGDYQGLFVGSQGQEVVGAVQFEYGFDGSFYTESGAMVVTSD